MITATTRRWALLGMLCIASSMCHGAVGQAWTEATSAAPWGPRSGYQMMSYQGKLMMIGGRIGSTSTGYHNDVWSSSDGSNWTCLTANASWAARYTHSCLIFRNSLWLIGGHNPASYFNDVWSTSDGTNWSCATTHAPFSPRGYFGATVYNGQMWIAGGYNGGIGDVWCSADGTNWTRTTDNAPYGNRRAAHKLAAFGGRLLLFGNAFYGDYKNDVWASTDGTNWTQITNSAGWSPRGQFSTAIYGQQLLLIGGRTDAPYNDVWSTCDGATWTLVTPSAGWPGGLVDDAPVANNTIWLASPGASGSVWKWHDDGSGTQTSPRIVTATLPNGTVGQPYTAALAASDGVTPYTWSVTDGHLPPGLSLDSGGIISGTASSPGTYSVTIRTVDANSSAATKVFSVYVDGINDGPIAYWSMNVPGSLVSDDTGHGHNGALTGATWRTDGVHGGCYEFDGVNDSIVVQHDPALNPEAMTITLWAYGSPTKAALYSRMIGKMEMDIGSGWQAYMCDRIVFLACPNHPVNQVSAPTPSAEQWIHIAMSLSGNNAVLYTNGVMAAQHEFPAPFAPATDEPLYIGTFPASGWSYYKGRLDEVKIWGRVLSAVEIAVEADMSNRSPTITVTPGSQTVCAGQTAQATIMHTDPEGTPLTVMAEGLPAGATLNADKTSLSWTPAPSQTGTFAITFTATDSGTPPLSASTTATVIVAPGAAPPSTNTDLIAWYTFDDSGNLGFDSSGKSHHGGNHGVQYVASGPRNGCAYFAGSGQYISVPHHPDFNLTNLTVTYWVKTPTDGYPTGQNRILGKWNNRYQGWFGHLYPNNGVYASLAYGSGYTEHVVPVENADRDEWCHVAMLMTPTWCAVYTNGALGMMTNLPVAAQLVCTNELGIGGFNSWGWAWLLGWLDEVKIWNGLLTPEHVAIEAGRPTVTNQPPVVSITPASQNTMVGQTIQTTVSYSDPEGTPVAVTVQGLPHGASLNTSKTLLTWRPAASQTGTFVVTFTATDTGTPPLSSAANATIVVSRPNQSPTITVTPASQSVIARETSHVAISCSDPEGTPVTVTAQNLPHGATLSTEGTLLTWIPAASQTGSFSITFTATDSGTPTLSASATAVIEVVAPNLPPTIVIMPQQQRITVGQTAQATISYRDPEGTPVVVSVQNLPAGAMLNADNTVLTWTPAADQTGRFTVTFSATDIGTPPLSASATALIVVSSPLPPLTILTIQLPEALAETPYRAQLEASGGVQPYTWSVSSGTLPQNVVLGASGAIEGAALATGVFAFTACVTDTKGGTAEQPFALVVNPAPTGGLRIVTEMLPDAIQGHELNTVVLATGGQRPYRWTIISGALPPDMLLNDKSGLLYGKPQVVTNVSFVIQVADKTGATAERELSFSVFAPEYVNILRNLGSISRAEFNVSLDHGLSRAAARDSVFLRMKFVVLDDFQCRADLPVTVSLGTYELHARTWNVSANGRHAEWRTRGFRDGMNMGERITMRLHRTGHGLVCLMNVVVRRADLSEQLGAANPTLANGIILESVQLKVDGRGAAATLPMQYDAEQDVDVHGVYPPLRAHHNRSGESLRLR